MKTLKIGVGDYLDTPYGYIKIKSRNADLIYCDSYDVYGEGCERDVIYVGEERYTIQEISSLVSRVGMRERVNCIWDNYR